jgi:transposase
MDTMKQAPKIVLNADERRTLEQWARGRRTPVRLVTRAQIVLHASSGMENKDIAGALGVGRDTVGTWRRRFAQRRLAGIIKDAPRGGRKPTRREDVTKRIVDRTTQTKPANATQWSTRTLAKELGVSPSMVQRVWQANGLKPHRVKTFKVSNDKQFVEKMQDIVGLYLNPPEQALVLCCDEKSQIQALDRTQPGLPIKKGRCGTMTHDYKRNGTTTLFAALELAQGRLIGTCMPRHRHQEWIKFLRQIDKETPTGLDLHLIVDNYATHKHPKVKAWLKRHPRFHIHFTPTSSSWLNLVERWFREISDKRIRRGVFKSVAELVAAIMKYIQQHNLDPQTFVWTAKAQDILAKVTRARARLDKMATE